MRISFKPEFIDKILTGQKTSTIRFDNIDWENHEGKILDAVSGNRFQKGGQKEFAKLRALNVVVIMLKNYGNRTSYEYRESPKGGDIDTYEKLAKMEGFASWHELHEWFVKNIYNPKAKLPNSRFGYLILFELV